MQVDEELKKAVGLTDDQYINQFPFEACLVMKHHLAETIQKVNSTDCQTPLVKFDPKKRSVCFCSQNTTKTYITYQGVSFYYYKSLPDTAFDVLLYRLMDLQNGYNLLTI